MSSLKDVTNGDKTVLSLTQFEHCFLCKLGSGGWCLFKIIFFIGKIQIAVNSLFIIILSREQSSIWKLYAKNYHPRKEMGDLRQSR